MVETRFMMFFQGEQPNVVRGVAAGGFTSRKRPHGGPLHEHRAGRRDERGGGQKSKVPRYEFMISK